MKSINYYITGHRSTRAIYAFNNDAASNKVREMAWLTMKWLLSVMREAEPIGCMLCKKCIV